MMCTIQYKTFWTGTCCQSVSLIYIVSTYQKFENIHFEYYVHNIIQWVIGVKIGKIIWEKIFFASLFFAQRQSHGIYSEVCVVSRCRWWWLGG